jgi:Zn-dependent M16 (insulinase) family peptidase
LAAKNEEELKAYIEGNKQKYGEKGLKQFEDKLKAAQEANDRPIPDAMISSFPIPSVDSIAFIDVESARAEPGWGAGAVQKHIDEDSAKLPYFVQYDRMTSLLVCCS